MNPDGTWQTNTYDASGIRSMIAENGITTEFMTFNGLVLGGYNKNGEQTEHYYYGNSLLAAEYAEADLYYYLKNSHGDVIGFTDNNGTLTETYRYDAFGTLTSIKSINENGVLEEAETALSRFLYAGEQYDTVTGLYYLRARQYDTAIGRFTQEDTYLGDGRNLYVYVSNNPLKYVDPSGHEKTGGYNVNSSEEIIVIFHENPYAEQKNIFEHINGLYKAFDEDAARATDDFCTGFFYGMGRYLSFGLYNDPEAENIRYEEAFAEGVGFAEILLIFPYFANALSNVVIKESYTPYYGNAGQTTDLVPVGKNGVISSTSGYNVIQMPPEYALTTVGTNLIKSGSTIHNDILDSPRVGSALKVDDVKPIYKTNEKTGKPQIIKEFPATAQSHGFNDIIDNYAGCATKTPLNNATLYQLEGSLNGVAGRFEWIIQDGNVTHRMFIPNGTMNGVPIKP